MEWPPASEVGQQQAMKARQVWQWRVHFCVCACVQQGKEIIPNLHEDRAEDGENNKRLWFASDSCIDLRVQDTRNQICF